MRIAVIGGGVVGLATAAALLERGDCEVRCFEAGEPMQRRSSGDVRTFRTTHADASLVGLALASLPLWDAWSQRAGRPLIDRRGLIYNGVDARERLAMMKQHGISAELVTGSVYVRDITTHDFDTPSLLDPLAGVIDVRALRNWLVSATRDVVASETVTGIRIDGGLASVVTASESWEADSVVIAAGYDTADLAGQVDMHLPAEYMRVARFTFRMRNKFAMPPCFIDNFDGVMAWGQSVGPGLFALGVHWPDEPTSMDVSMEASVAAQLQMAHRYLAVRADRLLPEPVQTLTCVADAGGDGCFTERNGPVLAVWGDNLFKFAPLLGARLASAATGGGLPDLALG